VNFGCWVFCLSVLFEWVDLGGEPPDVENNRATEYSPGEEKPV